MTGTISIKSVTVIELYEWACDELYHEGIALEPTVEDLADTGIPLLLEAAGYDPHDLDQPLVIWWNGDKQSLADLYVVPGGETVIEPRYPYIFQAG